MSRRERRVQQLETIWRCLKNQTSTEQILQQFLTAKKTEDLGVIPIIITLDLMQLAEMNSDLGNFIVSRPLEGTMLFREVVHEMLVVKGLLPDNGDLSRLAVSLRVNAATLPHFRWASGQQSRYSGLLKLDGIVLGMTATVTYTKSTKYTCPREDCEGHYGNQYVRIHVPGASEQETVGQKFRCSVCSMGLREDKSQRSLSDKLLAEVKVITDTQGSTKNTGHRQQAVAVIVRDDLCGVLQLGQRYQMFGIQRVSFEADSISTMFEVNNLLPVQEDCDKELLVPLPRSLQRLGAKWSNSPFVFPHLMAYHFAADVCPPNCFFKLKLLLLISLVLTPEVPQLHVLVSGSEAHLAQRLMEFALTFTTRHFTHTSLHVLGAKATTSRYPWASYFVSAGSLMMASGGVCMVGDLRTLKRPTRLELQTALNENRVQVALEARHTGSLPRVLSLPLSCHVWGLLSTSPAASAASASTNPCSTAFSYGATGAATDIAPALLDAFSLICQCDVNISSFTDVTEDLVSYILTSNMTTDEELRSYLSSNLEELSSAEVGETARFSFEDFKQYIQTARRQQCTMTVEGEWLLTSYLIAARHARAHTSQASNGTAVPLSAWNTLQALSHGLCRLSLDTAVTEAHALMAVHLYEEALTARHGVSALNVFPEPHLPADSAKTHITTQLDPDMRKFHSRLLHFCALSGMGPANSEE